MMKINLSAGNSEVTNIYDDRIKQSIAEFWNNGRIPVFQPVKLKFFKFSNNNSDKYIFLKIRNIKKRTSAKMLAPSNSQYWCKDGHVYDFTRNDLENAIMQADGSIIYRDLPTTSEIFGLHIKDFNELKKQLKVQSEKDSIPFDPKKIKLNAELFKDAQNNSSVFFYLTYEFLENSAQNGLIVWNKPGSSGVKVPKGGA